MKNLKKVLALVLVVATLMTMTTIASAKFTDDGSIEYNEAVEVMSMINVINGYTDGSFRPTANVTRAQMAKMVAYIVAGGEDVGNLYAGANSFSDCTTHWAKGYIAYANKTGIVAGVGNGKFNPEGSVTGTQAAKMMLCALGYDAKAEGYTGTNWAVNTLADAKAAGLLEGLSGVDMSKAMTREQAAQLMFNALKATMVYYENGNITIDSGDTNITIGGSAAKEVEVKGENASTNFDHTVNAATIGTKQLCEEYFSGLTLSTAGTDAFARTGNVWTYKNDGKTTDSAVYASAADYSIVVSESGKSVAQWAEKAYSKLNTSNATVYVNGVKTTTPGALLVGDQVEFFVDDNDANKVNEVVVIRYTADVITDVDTDVKDADAKDGVSAYVTFKNAGTFDDTDLTGYDVNTYKKDAVVALVEGSGSYAGKIVASYAPEAVEGAITAYTSTTYTIDGTKYTMVGGIGNNDEINKSVDFTNGSYKLYLDVNGYVLKTEVVKGTASINDVFYLSVMNTKDGYVYWTDTVSEKGQTTTNYYVQAVYMDGTVKEIEVASVKNTDGTKLTAIENYLKGLKAGFFTDEDKPVPYDTNKTYDVSLTVWSNSDYSTTGDLATGSSNLKINSDTKRVGNYYLSNNTQYVVIEKYTDSDTKVTVKTGSISYEEAANDIVMVIGSKSGGSTVADYVVIVSDTFTAAETGDYIYVDDNAATNVSGGKQYTVYTKDGEKTTIVVDKDSTKTTLSKNTFYKYAIMANGNYDIKDTMTANLDDGVTYTGSYNDLLTVSGNAKDIVTSDAAIVDVHDTDDYSKSVTTLAAMQTAKDANYTVTLQVVYTDSNMDEAEMIVVKSVVGTSSNVLDAIADGTAGVNGTMKATFTVDGNDVTATAGSKYISTDEADLDGAVTQISADLARFLGGLNNAGVKEIKYAGNTYKWSSIDTQSSKWTLNGENDKSKTLVKAVTDNWKGTDGKWGTSDDAAYTATLSIDGVNMTYTVSIAK